MEDLLEKYEQLYFSALEDSIQSGKSGIAATLKTLKLNLRLQRALLTRLELLTALPALTTPTAASTTAGVADSSSLTMRPACPSCGLGPCTPSCPERRWRYPEQSEQFNPPMTLPIEAKDGNVHVFEGAYIKSVERTYPEGSPIVEEPVELKTMTLEEAAQQTYFYRAGPIMEPDTLITSILSSLRRTTDDGRIWPSRAMATELLSLTARLAAKLSPIAQLDSDIDRALAECDGSQPGPEVLGNEEYDARQVEKVMQTVKGIPTCRLNWIVEENRNFRAEQVIDPGVKCWLVFAKAELERRRDAIAHGRPVDWLIDG